MSLLEGLAHVVDSTVGLSLHVTDLSPQFYWIVTIESINKQSETDLLVDDLTP